MAFTCLKVKSTKCLCLLPVVLVLCRKNLVLLTSLEVTIVLAEKTFDGDGDGDGGDGDDDDYDHNDDKTPASLTTAVNCRSRTVAHVGVGSPAQPTVSLRGLARPGADLRSLTAAGTALGPLTPVRPAFELP